MLKFSLVAVNVKFVVVVGNVELKVAAASGTGKIEEQLSGEGETDASADRAEEQMTDDPEETVAGHFGNWVFEILEELVVVADREESLAVEPLEILVIENLEEPSAVRLQESTVQKIVELSPVGRQ